MANLHPTPAHAIPMILNCVQEHLATRDDIPDMEYILLGTDGVGVPYGCCSGILMIESRGEIGYDRRQIIQRQPATISGCDPCDEVVQNHYRVTIKMCAPPFDSKALNGAPPKVADRNNISMLVMNETWELFQALRCCIPCQHARIDNADHRIVNGCATLWVDLTMEHILCCTEPGEFVTTPTP